MANKHKRPKGYKLTSDEAFVEELEKHFSKISLEPDSPIIPMVIFNNKKGLLTADALIYYDGKYYRSVTSFARAVVGRDITGQERNSVLFTFKEKDEIRWGDKCTIKPNARLLKMYEELTA
jgi:hypothetical protein